MSNSECYVIMIRKLEKKSHHYCACRIDIEKNPPLLARVGFMFEVLLIDRIAKNQENFWIHLNEKLLSRLL